jgi:methylmalonyl-CoA mutase cobalamin-binding domain/chain
MVHEDLRNALADLEEKKVYALIKEKIAAGISAKELMKACQEGMKIVGDRYSSDEYFIADMMYSGEIMRNVMNTLQPYLKDVEIEKKLGKVVIGTVKGDIHDLGKDTVIISLQGNGFEVIDLGVDVSPERFVQAIKENNPQLVGMSVFLTSCFTFAENIVKAIQEADLREDVRVMIGGAPVTEVVAERTGCDFYGKDAVAAVNYALNVVGA